MADLKTDYKDDVLDASVNTKRKWIITENGDGTVTIEDATTYSQTGDIFGSADLNAITLAVNECFRSVSNGKALIASAITDKKVPTDATATFAEMAENINSLKLGSGNAMASQVLSGRTFTNSDGVEYTGTMPNQGTKTQSLNCGGSYTIPAGYHNGSGKVTANSLASQTSANATAAMITKGYTAWVNGVKVTGTRPTPVTAQSGTTTGTTIKNATNTHVVTFAAPFDKIPTVKIGLSEAVFANNGSNATSVISISYSNVTRTGFTLTVKSSSTGYNVNWKVGWSAEA